MICPKCGAEQPPSPECGRCGLIFSKYRNATAPGPAGNAPAARVALPWNRLLSWALLAAAALFLVSWILKDRFPGREEILPDLLQEPVQAVPGRVPFQVEAGGVVYTISPVHAYEIRGMVVSHHDCGSWGDIYHRDRWKDFLNIKDLCMVWGPNLETEVYKDMTFGNDSWTCTWRWPNPEVGSTFRPEALSNNHLLCADETLQKRLLKTARGDQVRIRGVLAEYTHSGGAFRRGTSTRRSDTGNGACETIFVEEYEILKRANPFWRTLHAISRTLILGFLLLLVARFVRSIIRPPGRG